MSEWQNPFTKAAEEVTPSTSTGDETAAEDYSTDSSADSASDTEAKVEDKVEVKVDTKEAALAEIGEILAEHANMESNIPIGHRYWDLLNLHRKLVAESKG